MTLRLVTASIVTLPFMIKLGVILRGQSFVSTVMIALMPSAVAPYIISSGLITLRHLTQVPLPQEHCRSGLHCFPFY